VDINCATIKEHKNVCGMERHVCLEGIVTLPDRESNPDLQGENLIS
jgi:hypothetical protein